MTVPRNLKSNDDPETCFISRMLEGVSVIKGNNKLRDHSRNNVPVVLNLVSLSRCARTTFSISEFNTQHHASRSNLLLVRKTSSFFLDDNAGNDLVIAACVVAEFLDPSFIGAWE